MHWRQGLWKGSLVSLVAILAFGAISCAKNRYGGRGGDTGLEVAPFTLPPAGRDDIAISMEETYDIEGIGRDTVRLDGTLVALRGAPLAGDGGERDWDSATVVAEFIELDLRGDSDVLGPVRVRLDPQRPTFAAVRAGKCATAANVLVELPRHGLVLRPEEAVQLRSNVTRVPPIGDEQTRSVAPARLIDASGRARGTLEDARVTWRSLRSQREARPGVSIGGSRLPVPTGDGEPLRVEERSLPPSGVDNIAITMVETYDVEGIGKDTVELTGRLVAVRGTPLLGPDAARQEWDTSTVVARFTELALEGESEIFGSVRVTLDPSQAAVAAVRGGDCRSAVPALIEMPQHDLVLRTTVPVQLRSQVERVPPIGDETTRSLAPVDLVDASGRVRGRLESAQVVWRDLVGQSSFESTAYD